MQCGKEERLNANIKARKRRRSLTCFWLCIYNMAATYKKRLIMSEKVQLWMKDAKLGWAWGLGSVFIVNRNLEKCCTSADNMISSGLMVDPNKQSHFVSGRRIPFRLEIKLAALPPLYRLFWQWQCCLRVEVCVKTETKKSVCAASKKSQMMDELESGSKPWWKGWTNIQQQQVIILCQSRSLMRHRCECLAEC